MNSKDSGYGTSGTPDKGAEELRDMMGDVLRQIADTERRNATMLRSMQDRLESLNHGTRSVRAQAPAELAPQFDRIEDGMSLIAERVAETSAKLGGRDGNFSGFSNIPKFSNETISDDPFALDGLLSGGFDSGVPSSDSAAGMAPAPSAPGKPVKKYAPAASEPQPLRSAAGHHRPTSNGYRGNVDPFDVVESLPGNPADPWSDEGAAVLTDFYASGEPSFTSGFASDDTTSEFVAPPRPGRAPREANPGTVAPFGAAPTADRTPAVDRATAVDRDWLEGRLSDITSRLERTLSERRPDPSLAQFNERLSALEMRIAEAMQQEQSGNGYAAADSSRLYEIEAQIQALAGEFDAARNEIARLKAIEEQLGALMRQFTDERMGAIVGRSIKSYGPTAAPRDDNELQTIALAAAEAAVARMSQGGLGMVGASAETGGAMKSVEDLQQLMSGYIDERRQSDDQNAQIMDALQQAMLRVLDRLDAIEGITVEDQDYPGHDHDHQSQGYSDRGYDATEQHYEEPEPERHQQAYAPPQRDVRLPTLEQLPDDGDQQDPVSQQRASLQASAQRAALAQRDKLRDDPSKVSIRKPPPEKKTGTSRLMVSGLAICAVLGFAAYMIRAQFDAVPGPETASISKSADEPAAQAKAEKTAAPAATPQAILPQQAQSPGAARPKAAAAQSVVKGPRVIMPETVSEVDGEGILGGGESSERYIQPAEPRTHYANLAQPFDPSTSRGTAGLPISNAAANFPFPSQQPQTTAATLPADQSSALELPPATVGPLSMRIAAAKGDPSAEFEVATRLAEGKGTDQDFKEAYRWYQRSAAQNFAQSQYRLATLYERGLGTKADMGRARAMYQRAAEQGNVKSMHNLAVLAAGRSGGAPDYTTAATWFTQAANHGLSDSQFNLAVLTESGLGVEKDQVQAAMWFILAAQGGDKEALRRRDQMKGKMDKSDWNAAENLARSWQPMPPDKLSNDARFAGEMWKTRQAALPQPQ